MANVSFEEFYYNEDDQIHDLYEIQKEYEQNNGNISKYRGHIFCPECKIAELSFTHKTSIRRAFLSKIPSSDHAEYCSFKHDCATKSEIKQFVRVLSDKQIQDRLEAALNQLLPKKAKEGSGINNESKDNPLVIEVDNKKSSGVRKFIPRKSINTWFDKSEKNKIFIFYGHAKLETKEIATKNGKRYELIIKTNKQNEWIKKTSVFRGTTNDNIDTKKIYDIAILGIIEFYNDFPQIKTVTFSSIMFR